MLERHLGRRAMVVTRTVLLVAVTLAAWSPPARSQSAVPPRLILMSLDGFGWDFRLKTKTPALDALAARGVVAERLVPVFPTKTFPNHYSIVTGLYAEHHGIVSNTMYDPEFDATFSLGSRDAVSDGRWWGGEPIWVTAERQGLVAAAFFWPGTEAEIAGLRPTYWKPYDGDVPNEARVDTVLAWLDLPPSRRPAVILTYFSTVDNAAHRYGKDAEETRAAIREVDSMLGRLVRGIAERRLVDSVNVVIVSDHGMADTSRERVIFLDDYLDLENVRLVDWDPVAAIRPRAGDEERVYAALAGKHARLRVYRRAEIPVRWHYRDHLRIQPIIAVADDGWSITTRARFNARRDAHTGANHGFDNAAVSMGATFIAAGPAFRQRVVPPFQNVHLYELFCAVLGLEPAANDGSLDSVRVMLK